MSKCFQAEALNELDLQQRPAARKSATERQIICKVSFD